METSNTDQPEKPGVRGFTIETIRLKAHSEAVIEFPILVAPQCVHLAGDVAPLARFVRENLTHPEEVQKWLSAFALTLRRDICVWRQPFGIVGGSGNPLGVNPAQWHRIEEIRGPLMLYVECNGFRCEVPFEIMNGEIEMLDAIYPIRRILEEPQCPESAIDKAESKFIAAVRSDLHRTSSGIFRADVWEVHWSLVTPDSWRLDDESLMEKWERYRRLVYSTAPTAPVLAERDRLDRDITEMIKRESAFAEHAGVKLAAAVAPVTTPFGSKSPQLVLWVKDGMISDAVSDRPVRVQVLGFDCHEDYDESDIEDTLDAKGMSIKATSQSFPVGINVGLVDRILKP